MEKEYYWVAFFSQSGSEIVAISRELGVWPDRIVTNRKDLYGVHPAIANAVHLGLTEVIQVPNITEQDYFEVIPPGSFVTLHGFLKIVPPNVCEAYNIYNGHPGLISIYPELKGKDPQKKAVELNLPTIGSVIHVVTAGVDEGEILAQSMPYDARHLDGLKNQVEMVTNILHSTSVNLWVGFLLLNLSRSLTV